MYIIKRRYGSLSFGFQYLCMHDTFNIVAKKYSIYIQRVQSNSLAWGSPKLLKIRPRLNETKLPN